MRAIDLDVFGKRHVGKLLRDAVHMMYGSQQAVFAGVERCPGQFIDDAS